MIASDQNKEELDMELGDKIASYRQMQNMTQEDLAEKLGITPQAISKWERNQSMPDIDTFARLCMILSVDANEMLIKTIEIMEDELLKNPEAGADDLITAIASVIEGEDNYSVFMHNRRT